MLEPVYRFFMSFDALVSTGVYEAGEAVRRAWLAYGSLIERLRIRGPVRVVVDLVDDAATFGLVAAVLLISFALPPVERSGDVWNLGREYAVTLTDGDGEIIGRRGIRQDDAIPLGEVPKHVIQAVLATEDARFYKHFGVDVQGTLRAMLANARANDVVQGGSTLTQQLAKNLFLSPERTLRRKMHEAFLALWIEARLSKDEILKMYLDRSYLGGGTYGVEAAAQFYFGKSIRDVTLAEAAILGGLFKAPSKYAPHVNPEVARGRANVVLHRMLDVGYISQGELYQTRRQPAVIVTEADYYSPDYFLDWAYRETLDILASQNLTGDYVIEVKTTVDPAMQRTAQQVINRILDENGAEMHVSQGALVSMSPDGAIRAIVGGRDYENSQFNRATDALRQPGSAFKPFVYLAALRNGYTPDTRVSDSPVSIGGWSPKNYTLKYAGRTTLARALAKSYNTVPVHLMRDIGRTAIIETAQMAGVRSKLLAVPSLPLGTNELTVMDLTTGYAAFANGGRQVTPYAVLEIRRPNGELVYNRAQHAKAPPQVFKPHHIEMLDQMLNQVVVAGTGQRADIGIMPVAGKTGTTQSYRDAWFAGFTAHYVTTVWYGNDDYSEMNRVTGGRLPAMAWNEFMTEAHKTKIAAGIPGVPLDGSYARHVAESEGSLDIQLTPVQQVGVDPGQDREPVQQIPRTTARRVQPSVEDSEVAVHSPPARQARQPDAVVEVLQDMFSLFTNKPVQNRQPSARQGSSGPVFIFKPDNNRKQRAERNASRLRKAIDRR